MAAPPELLCFCLGHLAGFMAVPALFSGPPEAQNPSASPSCGDHPRELQSKLAVGAQLTPHEASNTLVMT